jgi:hypothetical protein
MQNTFAIYVTKFGIACSGFDRATLANATKQTQQRSSSGIAFRAGISGAKVPHM